MLGRTLILVGLVLVGLGLLLTLGPSMGWLGRLPGDIRIERQSFRFYFPITTSILLSVLLTLLLYVITRLR